MPVAFILWNLLSILLLCFLLKLAAFILLLSHFSCVYPHNNCANNKRCTLWMVFLVDFMNAEENRKQNILVQFPRIKHIKWYEQVSFIAIIIIYWGAKISFRHSIGVGVEEFVFFRLLRALSCHVWLQINSKIATAIATKAQVLFISFERSGSKFTEIFFESLEILSEYQATTGEKQKRKTHIFW